MVWLAQDVYAADLDLVKTVDDQLELILRGRDILVYFNDKKALSRLEKLMFATSEQDGQRIRAEDACRRHGIL